VGVPYERYLNARTLTLVLVSGTFITAVLAFVVAVVVAIVVAIVAWQPRSDLQA